MGSRRHVVRDHEHGSRPCARRSTPQLFDWTGEAPPELGGYTLLDTGAPAETVGGGIGAADPDGLPPGILLYVRVDDLGATLARAEELGGSTLTPPTEAPRGQRQHRGPRRPGGTCGRTVGVSQTDTVLRALAEPRRREMLTLLAHDELPVGRLAEAFDVTRSAVSQHLKVLEDAGLVTRRSAGTRNFYRSRPEGLAGLRCLPRRDVGGVARRGAAARRGRGRRPRPRRRREGRPCDGLSSPWPPRRCTRRRRCART